MANQNTKANRKIASKEKTCFCGKPCITSFKDKDKNPENKRKSAWKGCKRNPTVAKLQASQD